jgi:hypothetical protein
MLQSSSPRPALRRATRYACHLLAPLVLLFAAASHADAQMPRSSTKASIINWERGDASTDGYESVSGWFDYYLAPCVGTSITAQLSLRPSVTAAPIYWYKGRRYPLTPAQVALFDAVRPTRVDMVANFNATEPKELTAFEPSSASCMGWQTVASQRDYYPEKATRAEIVEALNRLSIANGTSRQPLRNPRLEQLFDQQVAQARRDSMTRATAARTDSVNRARAAQATQDSLARRSAATSSAAGTGGTGVTGGATRPGATGRSGSSTTTPAQSQADRQAAAQARADSVQRVIEEQQARNEARDKETLAATTAAVTTTVGLAQAMGSMVGGYYFTADGEPPANSTSYAVQTISGFGGGLSGRWLYVDAGIVSATLTDSYIAKMKKQNSYAPDKEQSGYFMSGGLSLEMPFDGESSFGFAPSLGYTYIVTTEEIPAGGVHAGFGVRLGSFKVRVDMGSGEYGSTYGIGGYIRF